MRFPIKYKIASIIIIVVVSMFLFAAVHFFWMYRQNKDEINSRNLQITIDISKDLDELIIKSRAILRTLAKHPSVIARNSRECDRLFAELLPHYPTHLNIVAAGMDGFNYGSGIHSAGIRRLNYKGLEWFQKASAGVSVAGDRHTSRLLSVPAVMIAEPVLAGNRRVGVLGLPFNMAKVRAFMAKEWGLPDKSTIDVIDSKGNNLICIYYLGGEALEGEEETACLVKTQFREGRGSEETAGPDGTERLYSFAQLAQAGWTVIVGVPVEKAYAMAYGMTRRFVIMILAGAVLAVVLGMIFSRNITRNISSLAKGLEAIERGDLHHQVGLSGDDELTGAAGSFNRMAEERRRAEESLRSREELVGKYNQALVELAKNEDLYRGELKAAFEAITEAAARALDVQRAGIWFSTDDFSGIRCAELYDGKERRHTEGVLLAASSYPSYFKALREENVIAAHDAHTDARTKEFSESYLTPLGISSMLDVPIRISGRTVGVVCHEQVGPPRSWTLEEQSFVTAISGFVSNAIEAHERRRAEDDVRRVNRALRTLSACNEALVRARDEEQFLNTICRTIVEEGNFRMCWIGFAERDEKKTVRPAAQAGFEEGYLDTLNVTWADSERGRGPTGTAIRTGQPAISRNIPEDPRFAPWRAEAAKRGYASSISLPLASGTETFGALNIYAPQPDAFDDREVSLLTELAGNLSYGITALRVRADREQKEQLIGNIFESMGEGLIVIDPEFMIISANKEYCTKVHMPLQDVIGRHCYEVSHHRQSPCYEAGEECPPRHTFRTAEPHVAVHTHFDKEGESIYSEVKSYPIKDGAGNVVSVIEIHNNITEKRRLEEQLRQAQKLEAIGTLAGGVAHDFNNILSAIIGYTHVALMKMKEGDPQRRHLEQVIAASERATTLTQSLLAFSRKQMVNLAPLDVNGLLRSFEKFLRRLIREDIELRTAPGPEELTVMADSGQIEQVLMNLVTNARDAMPQGGSLTIETGLVHLDDDFAKAHGYGKPGEYALISVTDTGVGMDERTREKIFEPFFTTKEQGKGTGLGLAMVYGIVKKHDGFINVYSEPGMGTTFKTYLPITATPAEKAERAERRKKAPVTGGSETILVAEDDDALRKLTAAVLRHFGYTVIEAVDGLDAIRKFAEHKNSIRLAVLDGIMPKKNGKEVYDEIQAMAPGLKVIFLSGYAEGVLTDREMREKALTFMLKPVSPNDLVRKVREELDRK